MVGRLGGIEIRPLGHRAEGIMSDRGTQDEEQPLSILVGSELSSVEFVRDYVQLRFDGPTLTAVTHGVVTLPDGQYGAATPGYRDALCSRIGRTVTGGAVVSNEEIQRLA